jgi:hypothetical protein
MEEAQTLLDTLAWLLPLILILGIWEMVWKIIAMWRSARNNHLICIAIINTAGILPIVYLLTHKSLKSESTSAA